MDKIIIIGGGGHAVNLVETIERDNKYQIQGFVDRAEMLGKHNEGYGYIGTDKDLCSLYEQGIKNAVMGIGYMGEGSIREELYCVLKKIGYQIPALTDETAVVSKRAVISEGVFIGKRAVVNAYAQIGENSIINSGAIIEHGTVVGSHSHIAVGAVVCGQCKIESGCFIGAGSVIKQGVSIGEKSLIGAGSVVLKSIGKNSVAYGNPCKEKV